MNEMTWKYNVFTKPVGDHTKTSFQSYTASMDEKLFYEIHLVFLAALDHSVWQQRGYYLHCVGNHCRQLIIAVKTYTNTRVLLYITTDSWKYKRLCLQIVFLSSVHVGD